MPALHRTFRDWLNVLAILLVFATNSQAQVSFSDSFDAGASAQWGNQRGAWTAAGGVYSASSPSSDPLTYSGLPFLVSNFELEVDINDVGDGGIWLRSDAAGENGVLLVTGGYGWGAGIPGSGRSLYWHVVTSGAEGAILNEAANVFTDPGNEDVHLRVTAVGDLYSVFVNGSATPATTLLNFNFPSGLIGLYDWSSQTFDNFTLVGVPEPQAAGLLLVAAIAVSRSRRRRRTELAARNGADH
jgi:hypothetical protein